LGLHPEGEDDPMVYPAEFDELLNKKMRYWVEVKLEWRKYGFSNSILNIDANPCAVAILVTKGGSLKKEIQNLHMLLKLLNEQGSCLSYKSINTLVL
jgi:hypothetical protein